MFLHHFTGYEPKSSSLTDIENNELIKSHPILSHRSPITFSTYFTFQFYTQNSRAIHFHRFHLYVSYASSISHLLSSFIFYLSSSSSRLRISLSISTSSTHPIINSHVRRHSIPPILIFHPTSLIIIAYFFIFHLSYPSSLILHHHV